MLIYKCVGLVVFLALPAWAQVENAGSADQTSGNSSQMLIPPPVGIAGLSTQSESETRSNYLRGSLDVSAAYIDNLYADSSATEISETIYTFRPSLSWDQTTERQHRSFTYSPGYTLYHPSGSLNQVDQNATAGYEIRLAPHVTLSANDTFRRSSTAYGEGDLSGGGVTGPAQPPAVGILAPFAEEMTNQASAELTVQTGLNDMIGFSGTEGLLDFPDPSQATGLFDSNTWGGTAFYSRRFSAAQYGGFRYGYSENHASQTQMSSTVRTNTISAYYTIFPSEGLSLSVSGGAVRYEVGETSEPSTSAWDPSWAVSLGWQGMHTGFAAGYSRSISGGGGLFGAYRTDGANGSFHWRMSQTWTADLGAAYYETKSVTPLLSLNTGNGHSVTGNVRIGHSFTDHLSANFEYDRVHQDYAGIESVALNPNSNRETVSLSWQFTRPVGQ
jgi:hypothetical protein